MTTTNMEVTGFIFQNDPLIYSATINGKWLLKHATPSWRIDDPISGFQRMVKEKRATQIAKAVLNQQRTFPNSIILATDRKEFKLDDCKIMIPSNIKFLVVDGQHRLWAQHYSDFEANYLCAIHMGLTEVEMARLFLEINDNQKRVPNSLRWDLVRLVRNEDNPFDIAAVDIMYALATETESPLYQRIDLTGEQAELEIKQGSLAPEVKLLISERSPFRKLTLDEQYELIMQYFVAIKNLDPDGWTNASSPFYKNRILRAFLKLLKDIGLKIETPLNALKADDFSQYLEKVDAVMLDPDRLRAFQGDAGISAIHKELKTQVFE